MQTLFSDSGSRFCVIVLVIVVMMMVAVVIVVVVALHSAGWECVGEDGDAHVKERR